MEAKKNPSKDVHRMRSLFFQIGLGISIAIMITAFEWRTEVKKVGVRIKDYGTDITPIIPITDPPKPEPTPPSPVKNDAPKSLSFTPITLISEPNTNLPDVPTIDLTTITSTNILFTPDEPEICEECIETFPEKNAEPIGGYEAFYKNLKDNLKYPLKAQRYDVSGRVFVEFIVNRDGTPVDMKVIKGIGAGCDEEAMRVIGLSKWNPGKQRGRPVRVKMVMCIVFTLN
jgi:protein TonB